MLKVYAGLIMAGLVFNFLETWYFGWNVQASCRAEMVCDYIAEFAMLGGCIGLILTKW